MYPGLEHAVYTPEDCLCVGGFVLNRENVSSSMSVVRTLDQHPNLTNDEAPEQTFRVYETYCKELVLNTTQALATPEEMERFAWALEDFLNHPMPKYNLPKKGRPSSEQQNRKEWCDEWKRFVTNAKSNKWLEKLEQRIENIRSSSNTTQ